MLRNQPFYFEIIKIFTTRGLSTVPELISEKLKEFRSIEKRLHK